jgi:hypothetical protein
MIPLVEGEAVGNGKPVAMNFKICAMVEWKEQYFKCD